MWFWLFPFPWELFIAGALTPSGCLWLGADAADEAVSGGARGAPGAGQFWGCSCCCIADPWSQPWLQLPGSAPSAQLLVIPAQRTLLQLLWGCRAGVCPWSQEMVEPQAAADLLTLPFLYPVSWAGMSQCSVLQGFTQGHALYDPSVCVRLWGVAPSSVSVSCFYLEDSWCSLERETSSELSWAVRGQQAGQAVSGSFLFILRTGCSLSHGKPIPPRPV